MPTRIIDEMRPKLRRVADALDRNRHAVAVAFKDSMADWEKYSGTLAAMGTEAFLAEETFALTDFLIRYLSTGDATWRTLFIGERLKQLHWTDSFEAMMDRREHVFSLDHERLTALLRPLIAAEDLTAFAAQLNAMRTLVATTARANREAKVLFIGDCFFLDLNVFLAVPLIENGITLDSIYATSKNPIELRNALRGLAHEKFDLVCYSPYSYEFNLVLAQSQYARHLVSSPRKLRRLAEEAHRQTAPTLRLLCELFDCNIVLHNTANVRRHNSTVANYAKSFATKIARSIVAKEANALLMQEMATCQIIAAKPIVLFDELPLVKKYGELTVGRKFYDTDSQHTTLMAQKLAEPYVEIIGTTKFLLGKKVVVLDLDNTLWDGIIGEGGVTHDHRRQQVLKLLRQKGVLLAIASKNDPQNVKWDGALLNEKDFVASQIHWEPKTLSLKRIAEELNLKLKDFVFIDDRPDEREMVQVSIPDVHCMDATDDATWRMLDFWAEALPEQNESDRTQMYLERKQRQTHLNTSVERQTAQQVFAGLDLQLKLRKATQKDLPRVTELINRTNQFNTTGARVSQQQITGWSESPQHHILVAEASDKFGAMGIISVMVVEQADDALQIPVWVLSCRVFGFGMETAMLNSVHRLAKEKGAHALRGNIVETPNNQPCRKVYKTNGFTQDGDTWERKTGEIPAEPAWLTVTAS